MKKDIFDNYVKLICDRFGITPEELFTKNKQRTLADARQLLYYMCYNRKLQVTHIKKYMLDNGYYVQHPTVIHGIKEIQKKMLDDSDYVRVINQLNELVLEP
jgi:chromosomal replication initiation ATPase DnaA